jgi:ABC-type lipoprotein release transport system permease subunit
VSILIFLGHHWLIVGLVVLAIALCALQPVLALAFIKGNWKMLLVLVLAVIASFYFEHKGEQWQKAADASLIAKKDRQLLADAASLRAAGSALTAQNEANAARIAAAEQAKRDSDQAKIAADHAADQMAATIAGFGKRLEQARKNPPCAVLLNTDVKKVCGL